MLKILVTAEEILFKFAYNGVNSYLFVNGVHIYKFKLNDSEIGAVR